MSVGEPITVLDEGRSWQLLASVSVGRLVTVLHERAEIFPVNFVVHRRTVLFRTAEGTKLLSTAMNRHVLFEADDHDDEWAWSVVVRGIAHLLATSAEVEEAEEAGLSPWTATFKPHFVRITPDEISGRRFLFGSESDWPNTYA